MNQSDTSGQDLDQTRWNAVCQRDAAHDHRFVFAVKTTGIYCRPSCPARRPRRENTEFFAAPRQARQQGFRACRRCHPDATADPHLPAVERACQLIENSETPPELSQLAQAVDMSPSHFHRQFKRLLGVTPRQYAQGKRVGRLQQQLSDGQPVSDAIYNAGFGAGSRVYESAGRTLGMTPGQYRKGGAGLEIGFATAESPLGQLLVAATGQGVCSIEFGDSPKQLRAALDQRFPNAQINAGNRQLKQWLKQVIAFLKLPSAGLDLPLDIQGTAFQQRVWQALSDIPVGTTASYSQVANRIDAPRAQRAVASACAANPVALAVPCHRVVRSDGQTGGYRWGAERKRQLLEREARATAEKAD